MLCQVNNERSDRIFKINNNKKYHIQLKYKENQKTYFLIKAAI